MIILQDKLYLMMGENTSYRRKQLIMATIRITDLRLRTIIGANDWERDNKQDLVINISLEFDATQASKSDNLADTVDYKAITKNIIQLVESSQYFLLEKLADQILQLVLTNTRIIHATVEIDKPQALRFADSVSIEVSGHNHE